MCVNAHGEWISVWFMGGYIRLKRLEQEEGEGQKEIVRLRVCARK